MSANRQPRIFGLDLMRAVAIVLVVFSHADDLLDSHWAADPGVAASDGVDLFFVLSGFLIGGVLLRTTEMSDVPRTRLLFDFWQRRWLRTLPNYYLFLLINVLLVAVGTAPGILHWNTLVYAVFLQNFTFPLDLFFWESWSLAVEEWFYLIFPVALLFVIPLAGLRHAPLLVGSCMILGSTFLRFTAINSVSTPFELDLFIRKVVVYRFDAIGYGALMAWAMHYLREWLLPWRVHLFLAGSAGLVFAALSRTEDVSVFNGTWYFTLSASSMALMLPLLAEWRSVGRWGNVVAFLSTVSYALYLVHTPVRSIMMPLMDGRSLEMAVLLYAAYWIICIAISALVQRYWERPFMALRDGLSDRLLRRTSA